MHAQATDTCDYTDAVVQQSAAAAATEVVATVSFQELLKFIYTNNFRPTKLVSKMIVFFHQNVCSGNVEKAAF